jgi:hypothetical protein
MLNVQTNNTIFTSINFSALGVISKKIHIKSIYMPIICKRKAYIKLTNTCKSYTIPPNVSQMVNQTSNKRAEALKTMENYFLA